MIRAFSRNRSPPPAHLIRQLPTQFVDQLLKGVTGVAGRALRPQTGDELVATEPRVSRCGQQGKKGKSAALGGQLSAGRIDEDETAQCLKPEHSGENESYMRRR